MATNRPIKKPQPTDMAVISTVTSAPCNKAVNYPQLTPN